MPRLLRVARHPELRQRWWQATRSAGAGLAFPPRRAALRTMVPTFVA